jgi:DNA polymerase-3 subunit gamma/tau
MSYLVLARKYRPQTFDEVIEQSHITKTLSHAIVAGRVAHALLFTGPRGTGKTTIARIIAKALNCKQGPTPTPCNQCTSCMEITNTNATDVFEIDGASNNSVDQVRELRENIPYMPSKSRYKIYIIDEVHMLSIAAFNALLKTLEEPPAHVLFIFATTEPEKIPVTILSRCQRHDMRRISTSGICEHLTSLCKKEGFTLPLEVLSMISREAGGSMRDAQSLLDQVLSCRDDTIEYDQILSLFGIIDRKVVFDLAAAVFNNSMADILDILANAYQRGQDMRKLYAEIVDHFRNLLVVKVGHNIENLIDLPQQEIDLLRKHGSNRSSYALSQLFDFLFKEEQTVRLATQPKLAIEMIFFRLLRIQPTLSIDELILKLDALKSDLPEPPPNSATKEDDKKTNLINETLRQDDPARPQKSTANNKTIASSKRSNIHENPMQSKALMTATSGFEPVDQLSSTKNHHTVLKKEPDKHAKAKTISDNNLQLSEKDLWQQLVSLVQKKKPSLGSIITKCHLAHIKNDCLYFKIDNNAYGARAIKKNLPQLNQWCRQITGKSIELKLITNDEPKNGKLKEKKQTVDFKNQALSHPVILDAIEVFNGKVTDVKILSGGKKI